jgi:hypothetical protein
MNIKQAIAYLIGKVKKDYYATRFFLSVVFTLLPILFEKESSNGIDGSAHKGIRDGIHNGDRESAAGGSQADSTRSVKSVRVSQKDGSTNSPCDELAGFGTGDTLDRPHDKDDNEQRDLERICDEALQNETPPQQGVCRGSQWDLLTQGDRENIILEAMWAKQWPSDEYVLFTVHTVIELCDRQDMHWDLTFDDLMSLNRKGRVSLVEPFTEKKLFPPAWGLRS